MLQWGRDQLIAEIMRAAPGYGADGPWVLSKKDPALATRRIFPLTLFLRNRPSGPFPSEPPPQQAGTQRGEVARAHVEG